MKIIGIGDSWEQYIGDKIGIGERGLLSHLSELLGVPIENLATAGDASEAMMGLAKRARLKAALVGAQFLVVSSGGDDVAGDQFVIWLNYAKDVGGDISRAVDSVRLSALMDLIMADYEDLASLRDDIAPNCIIVTHEYDFPVQAMMGHGILTLGPWLQPGLIECGWTNLDDQVAIVRVILKAFAGRLRDFAQRTRNVCHARTQGTLAADDWANEIHPNSGGFEKIAKVINLAIIQSLTQQAGASLTANAAAAAGMQT